MGLEQAADGALCEMLRAIEDKLGETGALVTATGDPESEVTLRLARLRLHGRRRPALLIDVRSRAPGVRQGFDGAEIHAFVTAKIAQGLEDLTAGVRATLLEAVGPVLRLNGRRV
ncbi:MAG TPA: hypothetical protein VFR91_05185 [Dyella sp.]|nr:hypothetical protein [Dyella sp.]